MAKFIPSRVKCSRCGRNHEYYLGWEPFSETNLRYICKVCWTEVMDKMFDLDKKFNLQSEKDLYEE